MKRFTLISIFIMLFTALLFADTKTSTATLQITGYKNMPNDGILRVYVYNTTSSTSSTTEVGKEIDVSDLLDSYISTSKDVFSIKVQTNLNKTITLTITVAPFTSQETAESVISTSYRFTTTAGTYTTTKSYSSYYYRYSAGMSTDKSTITVSALGSTGTATITQTISGQYRYRGNWYDYTIPSTYNVLYPNDKNATVDSTISVKMKLNTTKTDILANVKYVAPVIITVSAE